MAATAVAVRLAAGTAATIIVSPASRAAAHAVNSTDFQQVELARGVAESGEPMSVAILPDRSVLHAARNGVPRRTTGKCLDADGGSPANGTQLIILSCHGGTNQRWILP